MTQRISAPPRPPSKAKVVEAVADGIARAVKTAGGRGSLADRVETSPDTIKRALAQDSLPGFDTLLGVLLTDRTALDEAFALVGLRVSPLQLEAANDLSVIGGLNTLCAEWLARVGDGIRCHRDNAALAGLLRPLLSQLQAVVAQADAA